MKVNDIRTQQTAYNVSFVNQVFPSRWKQAEVMPIPKSSDRDHEQADNNRPISLLPILCKSVKRLL
jgi:hypothetical protein